MAADEKPAPPPGGDPVLRTSRAFMEARLLLTAAELDLFTELARQPATAATLAQSRRWKRWPLAAVLDALVGMGLLVKRDHLYHCPPEVSAKLSADSPDSLLASVLHAADLWDRWSGLTARVAGGKPGAPARLDYLRAFIGAMDVTARPLAPRMAAAVNPTGARRLLDLGGASGTYTMAFLDAAPAMQATLYDLADVIALARERLTAAGYLDRVTLVAGDYLTDPLPGGHDLAWLSAVIHSNGMDETLALYRKVHGALVPGGRIVIRDHVMSEDRTAPRAGALFNINMLVATRAGRTYTYAEIEEGLQQAGFRQVRLIQVGETMDGLVEARKPA
jgi:predicted O-methyltransferase YrrM